MSIRFDAASNTFWIPRPDRLLEAQLDAEHDRILGELRWMRREKGIIKKAAEFVAAVTIGQASPEIVKLRQESCFGIPGVKPPCSALTTIEGNKFCGACSCGRWLLSSLSEGVAPKLQWATLNCPLRRPGFSNS